MDCTILLVWWDKGGDTILLVWWGEGGDTMLWV